MSRAVFLERTHHRPLVVAKKDRARGSFVGGPPPKGAIASKPKCPCCGKGLMHQFTLGEDTLGALCRERSLTLFCCRDLACRLKHRAALAPSPLVFVVHDDPKRATGPSRYDSPAEGRGLALGKAVVDVGEDGEAIPSLSKAGGRPGYINNWGEDEQRAAEDGGRTFLLQWSEDIYPLDMEAGPMPFLFGAVYIFSRRDKKTRLPTLEDAVAFWQNT
jgi:hypothetical protein